MADRDERPTETDDPALAIAARHALHDEELIAAFAVDGEGTDDSARATSMIERCAVCRDLHADLVAIHGALKATGTAEAVAARQAAPRDFRLSAETANRLRPGAVVVRLRDRVAAAFGSFGRPMGMSMAALGVVGLLLGTFTLGGGAALGPALDEVGTMSTDTAAPGATRATIPAEMNGVAGSPGSSLRMSAEPEATAAPASTAATAAPEATVISDGGGAAATGGPTLSLAIFGGSIALLVAGVALFLLGSRQREPIRAG